MTQAPRRLFATTDGGGTRLQTRSAAATFSAPVVTGRGPTCGSRADAGPIVASRDSGEAEGGAPNAAFEATVRMPPAHRMDLTGSEILRSPTCPPKLEERRRKGVGGCRLRIEW